MQDKSKDFLNQKNEGSTDRLDNEADGRNKEWQDRARVTTEKVPEGTKTNIERDFEPETLETDQKNDDETDLSVY